MAFNEYNFQTKNVVNLFLDRLTGLMLHCGMGLLEIHTEAIL